MGKNQQGDKEFEACVADILKWAQQIKELQTKVKKVQDR